MLLINGTKITLVYQGNTYTKEAPIEEITMATLHAQAQDFKEIYNLCFPAYKTLLLRDGFWKEGESIYYKNIKISIPKVLVEKMLSAQTDEFQRLVKFWCWLSLNPNPRSRENLYGWIEKNDIQLTNGGLMILYRRVNKMRLKHTALGRFVEETYEKLRKQKKSTNVLVQQDKEDGMYCVSNTVFHNHVIIGNLKELYHQDTEKVFTDSHTGKERYQIGVESFMEREDGDESSAECSKG